MKPTPNFKDQKYTLVLKNNELSSGKSASNIKKNEIIGNE